MAAPNMDTQHTAAHNRVTQNPLSRNASARLAANRRRQQELYGAPLRDRVHALTGALGVSQARLAHALGVSPAMLSQLASGRQVKIGDPAVLARLDVLDRRLHGTGRPASGAEVENLLIEVAATPWRWTGSDAATAALRGLSAPARLAAAAVALTPAFPELAAVLRRAAAEPRVERSGASAAADPLRKEVRQPGRGGPPTS